MVTHVKNRKTPTTPPKTPPSKKANNVKRRSPRGHKTSTGKNEDNTRKKGTGPQGRGGKIRPADLEPEESSTGSSESESPRSNKSSTQQIQENNKKRGAVTQGRGGKTPPRLPPEESPYESLESGESSDGDEGNDGRMATREELLSMLRSKERTIKKLQAEVHSLRNKTRPNKSSLRSSNNWTTGEINFAEDVNTFVREFLFPRYKFLGNGWQNYLPDQQHSLSTLCLKKLALPEGSDKEDVWERVIVPSIQMKYINIKGNMNSDLKKNFMSMSCILFRHFR